MFITNPKQFRKMQIFVKISHFVKFLTQLIDFQHLTSIMLKKKCKKMQKSAKIFCRLENSSYLCVSNKGLRVAPHRATQSKTEKDMKMNYYRNEYTAKQWAALIDKAHELGCVVNWSKYGNIAEIDSTAKSANTTKEHRTR